MYDNLSVDTTILLLRTILHFSVSAVAVWQKQFNKSKSEKTGHRWLWSVDENCEVFMIDY